MFQISVFYKHLFEYFGTFLKYELKLRLLYRNVLHFNLVEKQMTVKFLYAGFIIYFLDQWLRSEKCATRRLSYLPNLSVTIYKGKRNFTTYVEILRSHRRYFDLSSRKLINWLNCVLPIGSICLNWFELKHQRKNSKVSGEILQTKKS